MKRGPRGLTSTLDSGRRIWAHDDDDDDDDDDSDDDFLGGPSIHPSFFSLLFPVLCLVHSWEFQPLVAQPLTRRSTT